MLFRDKTNKALTITEPVNKDRSGQLPQPTDRLSRKKPKLRSRLPADLLGFSYPTILSVKTALVTSFLNLTLGLVRFSLVEARPDCHSRVELDEIRRVIDVAFFRPVRVLSRSETNVHFCPFLLKAGFVTDSLEVAEMGCSGPRS